MFTTNDLRHFLEGLAILFAIGYWGTMLLLLWFLVRFAYKKPKQNAGKILSGSLTAAAILILFVWMIPKQFGPSKEEIQAQEEWEIVSHIANTGTGFSSTPSRQLKILRDWCRI